MVDKNGKLLVENVEMMLSRQVEFEERELETKRKVPSASSPRLETGSSNNTTLSQKDLKSDSKVSEELTKIHGKVEKVY